MSTNVSPEQNNQLYATVISKINLASDVLGIDARGVNDRIKRDLNQNINQSTAGITAVLGDGLRLTKDLHGQTTTLPAVVSRDVSSLTNVLNLDTLDSIPTRVKLLLASFQNAVEDPTSLYPRLACCADVPIDPAKIYNFSKKHKGLEKLYQADEEMTQTDRSMPNRPKSAEDVITNVNSSLESLSDLIIDAVNDVKSVHTNVEEIKTAVTSLKTAVEPVDEVLNKQEEASGLISRLENLFGDDEEDSAEVSDRGLASKPNPMQLVNEGTTMVDEMNEIPGAIEDSVAKLRNVKAMFTELTTNLKALFTRAVQLFENLVTLLKRFIENLPRVTQELRQFFLPTGLRALLMRPSQDLLSLLQNIEQLQAGLPDPDAIDKSVKGVMGAEGPDSKVEAAKSKLEEVLLIPRQFVDAVTKYDLKKLLEQTMHTTLLQILDELKDSALGGLVDGIGDALGINDDAGNGNDEGRIGDFVQDMAEAGGGLFKKLF